MKQGFYLIGGVWQIFRDNVPILCGVVVRDGVYVTYEPVPETKTVHVVGLWVGSMQGFREDLERIVRSRNRNGR